MFKADWPAPFNVKTAISTREGGVSLPPYDGLNLGSHVNDRPDAVAQNRQLFRQQAKMPAEPLWLNQVHGTVCVVLEQTDFSAGPFTADASTTKTKGLVSVILTADCLPVLFCDVSGTQVAAAHAFSKYNFTRLNILRIVFFIGYPFKSFKVFYIRSH